jgi:glycosyltransferase involved in cell wall biosynthesis
MSTALSSTTFVPPTSTPTLTGKRVAVIVFSYFPNDPRVYRAATALAEAGAKVDLFCLGKGGEPKTEALSGVNVTRVGIKKSRAGKLAYIKQYVAFTTAAFGWLSKRSLKLRYHLVHVHNMPDFLVFSALLAKALGSRVVLDLHDPMPEVFIAKYGQQPSAPLIRLLRLIEKLSIRFADLVLTPNLAFRKLFIARSGRQEKIQIVMNSPLEEIFPLRPPARSLPFPGSLRLMYHGTLVERHGLHVAVNALYDLLDDYPGLTFAIYGAETPYLTETVLPLVKELDLTKVVTYYGEVSLEVISRAIADCDLGLIPNLRSAFTEINFPTRIFEYLALGKPVIVPQTPGITDYFGPEDMIFFNRESEDIAEIDLAYKIKWVFNHPAETAALVEKGQAVYRRHLWAAERDRFLRLVGGLLK